MSGIIQFPTDWYRFTSGSFFLSTLNFKSVSPWSGRQSISGPNSQLWQAEVTFAIQERSQWIPLEGMLAQLAGQSGLLRFGDFAKRIPQRDMEAEPGSQPWSDSTFFSDGSGFIEGLLPPFIWATAVANRGETSIMVGGLPASEARVLRRGDNFEHQPNGAYDETPRFHILTRDAPTDADGKTRLQFRPPLRGGVAAGDKIVLTDPMCTFRLGDDNQGVVTRTAPYFGDLGIKMVEAIV